jgi:hypothetical protein
MKYEAYLLLGGKASLASMADHCGTADFQEHRYAIDLSRLYTIFINISRGGFDAHSDHFPEVNKLIALQDRHWPLLVFTHGF